MTKLNGHLCHLIPPSSLKNLDILLKIITLPAKIKLQNLQHSTN